MVESVICDRGYYIIVTMPKLLLLSKKDEDQYRRLIADAHLPGLDLVVSEPADDCDIVLGSPHMLRELLPSLPTLRWAQSSWAGVEPLLDPSLRRDYILTNARGIFGGLMSEYVFGYILAHEKRIFERRQSQQEKKWDRAESGLLRGKTLGLLGVGSIGAHLAATAKHFGMKVKGYTRSSRESKYVDVYFHGGDLLPFADGLDYLVVILPNTNATTYIVNASLLNALPSQTVVINVGRGNAVDESALVEALTHNRIAGAVLDVTEQEPLPAEHPFWTTPNLLLTFHTSAMSYPEDIMQVFVENYHLYIQGKPLKYQVNFERGY